MCGLLSLCFFCVFVLFTSGSLKRRSCIPMFCNVLYNETARFRNNNNNNVVLLAAGAWELHEEAINLSKVMVSAPFS